MKYVYFIMSFLSFIICDWMWVVHDNPDIFVLAPLFTMILTLYTFILMIRTYKCTTCGKKIKFNRNKYFSEWCGECTSRFWEGYYK